MGESTGFFGRTWSGKLALRDADPWDAVYAQAAAYRERFDLDGTALTREEAAALYRLVAPLCDPAPDPDKAERSAAVRRFSCFSPHIGRTYFNVEHISGLLVAFEAEHAGEWAPNPIFGDPLGEPWERYFALRFLQLLVSEDLISFPDATIRELIARAVPILERERPVTRPRGRHNPAVNDGRDLFIRAALEALEGCGLPVTTRGGDSLAGVLAEALKVSERTIKTVWERWPLREHDVNDEMPAEFRMPESLTRRPRERSEPEKPPIALDVRCARCGKAGKVPVYRTREGGTGQCTDCLPW